jgi:dynein heavy chain, axonemal
VTNVLIFQINGFLVELVELPQEQVELQIATVNWFNTITNVFELNASLFEQYKFQFEEKLQDVTRQLGEKIDELIPKLTVINDMYDTDKLRDYYQLLLNFIDQIKIFDDYVQWINKEEVLFKFPKSQYPVLENVKLFVIPFIELMR